MGCSASIACYPAKIPHFFESLKILAFYANLLRTPLIACKSFTKALLAGFQRDARRSRPPIVDGLNGLRPTLRAGPGQRLRWSVKWSVKSMKGKNSVLLGR